jgi:peptide/nickel transport system ATP-binding protein
MDPDHRTEASLLTGDPPNPINPPSGCRFRTRCAFAEEVCAGVSPALDDIARGHQVACHMMVPSSGHSRAGTICAGHD